MITATVSGSFHRFMIEIDQAVQVLASIGVKVVSPADPRVVDAVGEFLFVASDKVRSIRLVQDRHLESIAASTFVWLVCPDGYVGQSAAMEVGFAVANGVDIFSTALPADLTLRNYVQRVDDIHTAVRRSKRASRPRPQTLLIDPHATIETAHRTLDRIGEAFKQPTSSIGERCAYEIYAESDAIAAMLPVGRSLRT